ncbi:MAG: uroporphyrinogen-III C-methyltransferase [Acidobacteriota bacterium]|nr:uroporphyrinogen-III C-methyltransferase [Acidobacteriota bacterium]
MNRPLILISEDTSRGQARAHAVMADRKGIFYEWHGSEKMAGMLLRGEADLWITDAASVPYPLNEGLELAALIPEKDSLREKAAVICRADRAEMRGLFHSSDARNSYGKVWLVGAGPGSADLITLRAQRILAKADIVYYDDLLDSALLQMCPGERRYVGKRKGCVSCPQDDINAMLCDSALQGKSVVRLKGGDCAIFGRAGEELDYLRRRWIRVAMVPGVTSASAASAAALFSLTQRQISRSVTFLSGHGIERGTPRSPEMATFVYYMAASKLKEIARDLLREGFRTETPVAIICNAGAWNESCIRSTVAKMQDLEALPPALLVVGETAALARIEKKALFTGIHPDTPQVPEPVVHQPLIEAVRPSESGCGTSSEPMYRAVEIRPVPLDLTYFSAVVFTTPLEVEIFAELYGGFPSHLLCYAFDDATRAALTGRAVHLWRIVPCPIQKRIGPQADLNHSC